MSRTGVRDAVVLGTTPPLDVIQSIWPSIPLWRRSASSRSTCCVIRGRV